MWIAEQHSLHPQKETADTTPPLTTRQSQQWQEMKKLEACIEGAMRGNWRDVRTVFNAVGLTPFKPPRPVTSVEKPFNATGKT